MKFSQFSKFNKNVLALAMFSVAALSSCTKEDVAQLSDNNKNSGEDTQVTTVEDRYIVTMKADAAQGGNQFDGIQKMLTDKNLPKVNIEETAKFEGGVNGFVATLTPAQVDAIKASQEVESVEPEQGANIGWQPSATKGSLEVLAPSDQISAMATTGATLDYRDPDTEFIPWGVTRVGTKGLSGEGKTAWIIDSGIDFNHYELNVDKGRSKSFLTSKDGGNWSSPADELGHGTAVAGIIGARDNGKGIIGVAPGASLVSLRVVNKYGKVASSNLIKALDHAYANAKPGDVVNISLQFSASTTIDNAVKKLASKGVFVTIGAGNSAMDCGSKSPQRVNATNVFTVSAMNNDNTFWASSNYGSSVDFTAPGTKIMTTEIGGSCNWASGTSFSAPHLAGLLLVNGGKANMDGYVINDRDNKPDGISHK